MKKICFLSLFLFLLSFTSCGNEEELDFLNGGGDNSGSDSDNSGTGGDNFGSDSDNSGAGGDNFGSDSDNSGTGGDGDENHQYACTPGETQECYEGPSGTSGVGICKSGIKTCVEDGTDWSECRDQKLPEPEICSDGIDQDCDGSDMTPETAIDIDGDGYTYCTGDCCETGWECYGNPAKVGPGSFEIPSNGVDDNCDGHIDEKVSYCDSGLNPESSNPLDFSSSIDVCPALDDNMFGVISAKLLMPDGTEKAIKTTKDEAGNQTTEEIDIPKNQYAILPAFGNIFTPNAGTSFFALSTGTADTNNNRNYDNQTSCQPPSDWFQANGGSEFPNSPSCVGQGNSSGGGKPPIFDAIMLELEIRVPNNAKSFSVDVNFFSQEFPDFVCSEYNDFFIMLLDSDFTSDNPAMQNPQDKNIARDENDNPCGINLAKSGLFKICKNKNFPLPPVNFPGCAGDVSSLVGTGFDLQGATGWLEVRGNVVPKEIIKLRMAIWDTGDHVYDSLVLLDNFTWHESSQEPGIREK